jgi:hypothetical protein
MWLIRNPDETVGLLMSNSAWELLINREKRHRAGADQGINEYV